MDTRTEKALNRFLQSEIYASFISEIDNEENQAAERERVSKELTELKKARPAKMAAIQNELLAAHNRVDKAKEELRNAKANFAEVTRRTFTDQWDIDEKIRNAEHFLMRTAPANLKTRLNNALNRIENLRERAKAEVAFDSFPDIPEAFGKTESDRPKESALTRHISGVKKIEAEIENIKSEMLGGN